MINLLPPQEKESLQQIKRQKITLILGFVIFAFLVCASLILFVVNIRLDSKISAESIFLDLSKKGIEDFKPLQDKLQAYNNSVSAIEAFYTANFSLSETIQHIASTLPPGVYLKSLSYRKSPMQFQLTGYSPTGETLKSFKENLEGQGIFYDIVFPPSTWAKLTDVEFTASFNVKTNSAQ